MCVHAFVNFHKQRAETVNKNNFNLCIFTKNLEMGKVY